jgi:hypothetical protein
MVLQSNIFGAIDDPRLIELTSQIDVEALPDDDERDDEIEKLVDAELFQQFGLYR